MRSITRTGLARNWAESERDFPSAALQFLTPRSIRENAEWAGLQPEAVADTAHPCEHAVDVDPGPCRDVELRLDLAQLAADGVGHGAQGVEIEPEHDLARAPHRLGAIAQILQPEGLAWE